MPSPPRSRTDTFHLDAPRARVFPLFTAHGEREWAPGWDPTILSGDAERGSAFETCRHGQTTTWIVVEYCPAAGRASYARLAQGSHIGLVDVVCTDHEGGGTQVSVSYTLTPLNDAATAGVEDFLEPRKYAGMIEEWRAATAAALARLTAPAQITAPVRAPA